MLKKTILILTALLPFSNSYAEIYTTNKFHNIRSSPYFDGSKNNIIDAVPPGTQFKVISEKTLPSGAKAQEIQIISEQHAYLNEQKPLFIWNKLTDHFFDTQADVVSFGCEDCSNTADSSLSEQPLIKISKDITHKIEEDQNQNELDTVISNYSKSEKVQTAIDTIYKNSRKKSSRKCARYVKSALRKAGLVSSKPYGHAKDLAKELANKHGFINLLNTYKDMTPDQAPKGAVMVYSGGFTRKCHGLCGHTEIKLTDGADATYGSDYLQSPSAMEKYGNENYKLIGIMIKPVQDGQ